ncbi:DUF2478 domain-containing protein [Breoghania sp.]|uniref:DUF2478 domain-containing protein n=1 Tax=Breoghania sp. TaxID=2065378 RepID=UPI002633E0AD|nr:DUF2478 domain-containing protein [Breoghania sp.]
MPSEHRLAAVAVDDPVSIEPLFDEVLAALSDEGREVAGFIQREICGGDCQDDIVMEDIETGERLSIMQMLGPASRSCRLDLDALVRVSVRALTRLNRRSRPDLMIVNRFGHAEVEGGGMRPVFEKALGLEIPVLTSVYGDSRSAWSSYVGDLSNVLLPVGSDTVMAWYRGALENLKAR